MTPRPAYLLLIVAAPLAAQELDCTAGAGVPPLVRAEGADEYVADIAIACKGGTPTLPGNPSPQYTLQVSLNTSITSRLTANPFSEALLLVEDPAPNAQRYISPKIGFSGPRAIWTAVQNLAGTVSPGTAAGSILSTF